MRVAVIRFPGSNCDQDALYALRTAVGVPADYVWHQETSLSGFDGVYLPGGFSYGDYLRCGAMAARSPIMAAVKDLAAAGAPVLGICNGFQVLCEAGLLPGALLKNESERFICKDVYLRAESNRSFWTANIHEVLRIPVAHGEGRYSADREIIDVLEETGRIAFRYVDAFGEVTAGSNPNGSTDHIAGVLNEQGNVLGMMPHPERAASNGPSGADGLAILRALQALAV